MVVPELRRDQRPRLEPFDDSSGWRSVSGARMAHRQHAILTSRRVLAAAREAEVVRQAARVTKTGLREIKLWFGGVNALRVVWRRLADSKVAQEARRVVGLGRARLEGSMGAREVLWVVDALEASGETWWLAGGWGVDALLGRQTRWHHDLDVVVDDYRRAEPVVQETLAQIGFRRVEQTDAAAIWMPLRTRLDDGAGHRIELLHLNRELLGAEFTRLGATTHDPFTVGKIRGRKVPCISADAQRIVHTRYEPREVDSLDLANLAMTPGILTDEERKAETSLIVPVPSAALAVERVRRRLDPSAAAGMPPHITILYPFMPVSRLSADRRTELSTTLASTKAFTFTLDAIGWFDNRVMYITPNPSQPFVELTSCVSSRYPDWPPYGGTYREIVPHLSVAQDEGFYRMRWAASRVARRLPLRAHATEAWLMAYSVTTRRWRLADVFPLGTV
jgi:2'-5' RNA ligase